jgi:hypothetical protein
MGKNPQVVDSAIASKSQPMSSRLPGVAFCHSTIPWTMGVSEYHRTVTEFIDEH